MTQHLIQVENNMTNHSSQVESSVTQHTIQVESSVISTPFKWCDIGETPLFLELNIIYLSFYWVFVQNVWLVLKITDT